MTPKTRVLRSRDLGSGGHLMDCHCGRRDQRRLSEVWLGRHIPLLLCFLATVPWADILGYALPPGTLEPVDSGLNPPKAVSKINPSAFKLGVLDTVSQKHGGWLRQARSGTKSHSFFTGRHRGEGTLVFWECLEGWERSLVVQFLPSRSKVLSLITSTMQEKKERKKEKNRKECVWLSSKNVTL